MKSFRQYRCEDAQLKWGAVLFFVVSFISCPGISATLTCTEPVKDVSFRIGEKERLTEFKITNAGDTVLRVLSAKTSCTCTVVEIPPTPLQPGETASILALTKAVREGFKDNVLITIVTDHRHSEVFQLRLNVTVPEEITLSTRAVVWKKGGEMDSRTITIRKHADSTLRIVSVRCDNSLFAVELSSSADNATASIRIRPKDASREAQGVVDIVTAGAEPVNPNLRIFAFIR